MIDFLLSVVHVPPPLSFSNYILLNFDPEYIRAKNEGNKNV